MDQSNFDENDQNVMGFNSNEIPETDENSTILSPISGKKLNVSGNQNLDVKFASQTPEKTNESLHTKLEEEEYVHLEKYKSIVSLFESMICSWRLLSLCKKLPTYQNIAKQVETLTKREFLRRHLAQIKFVLPEAIQIDEILVHNKKTLCMVPDMKISLVYDVVEGHSQKSEFVALRQVFASRIVSFSSRHPEVCDIPEATLPKVFSYGAQNTLGSEVGEVPEALGSGSRRSQTTGPGSSPEVSLEPQSILPEPQLLSLASLPHPSVSRHFSQKIALETKVANILRSKESPSSGTTYDDGPDVEFVKTSQFEENNDMKTEMQKELPDMCSPSTIITPHSQLLSPKCNIDSSANESPQQKLNLSDDSPMIETPAQVIPKRSVPSCDEKLEVVTTTQYCYKPAKRSLNFSHLEGNRSTLYAVTLRTDDDNVLYDDAPQALQRKVFLENKDSTGSVSGLVKGSLGNLTEYWKMSQQIIGGMPDLVTLIHRIFQCVNYYSITKQELLHKIIMNNLDIVEKKEVEEQIELLEKLVPDWFYKKLTPSGDVMYNIKKVSDLASVKARVIIIST